MTTLREAAQQALEACTDAVSGWQSLAPLSVRRAAEEALQDLRDALAEPPTNQCGETCERAKLCAACARELSEPVRPLAEWQINDLMADIDPEDVCSWSFRQGVYAAEKHHGIRP